MAVLLFVPRISTEVVLTRAVEYEIEKNSSALSPPSRTNDTIPLPESTELIAAPVSPDVEMSLEETNPSPLVSARGELLRKVEKDSETDAAGSTSGSPFKSSVKTALLW